MKSKLKQTISLSRLVKFLVFLTRRGGMEKKILMCFFNKRLSLLLYYHFIVKDETMGNICRLQIENQIEKYILKGVRFKVG